MNEKHQQAYEEEQQRLKARMSKIKHKIAVISGKGGVGKSTVTVNLAMAFAMHGYPSDIGILDADITGPCVPKLMGLLQECPLTLRKRSFGRGSRNVC